MDQRVLMPTSSCSLIYVSQGRSARLIKEIAKWYGIGGLYTDHYTTCNIVICMSENKLSLTHADQRTNFAAIQAEIEWSEANEIILISRTEGSHLNNRLVKYFQKKLPHKNIVQKQVDKAYDGITASFSPEEANTLHPQIQTLPSKPGYERLDNLLHHPLEEKMQMVTKIQQTIGLVATALTGQIKYNQPLVFDGYAWKTIESHELEIDMSHVSTQTEMKYFNKTDTFIELWGKVEEIDTGNSKSIPFIGNLKYNAMIVAIYVEGYLQGTNSESLFKRNMPDLFIFNPYSPISTEDKNLKQNLLILLKDQQKGFKEINELIENFQKKAPETDFKKSVLDKYLMFKEHYLIRNCYDKLREANHSRLTLLKNKNELAVSSYQAKDYQQTEQLFAEVIKEAVVVYQENAEDLAMAYYNYGRILCRNNQLNKAEFFLKFALDLREKYYSQSIDNIKKSTQALRECRTALLQLHSNDFILSPQQMQTAPMLSVTTHAGSQAEENVRNETYRHPVFSNIQTTTSITHTLNTHEEQSFTSSSFPTLNNTNG